MEAKRDIERPQPSPAGRTRIHAGRWVAGAALATALAACGNTSKTQVTTSTSQPAGLPSSGSSFIPAGPEVPIGSEGAVPIAGGVVAGPAGEALVPLEVEGGQLVLEVCAENIVRVAYSADAAFFTRPSAMAAPKRCDGGGALVASNDSELTIRTPRLGVRVQRANGHVSFFDAGGKLILSEKSGARTLTPATVQGEATWNVRQEWLPNADESLYGLGQRQDGLLDIKGYDLDLKQYNTQVTVPFLVSSRGYGVLWDNTSFTRFGDVRPFEPIPGAVGLYTPANDGTVDASAGSVNWEGTLTAPTTGEYLFQTYSGGEIEFWVDDALLIDHWRQGWLPSVDLTRVHLEAGQTVRLRLAWASDIGVNQLRFHYKTPAPAVATESSADGASTSLWSQVGDGVDYYFVYGPDLDDVVGGYRQITGPAPMMPSWAFGLWQSRERYQTQQASLDVAAGFRSRSAPVDVIVQDWQFWTIDAWGSHAFDPVRFPDPDTWIRTLHDTHHTRLMISVWPKFYTGTANFEALRGAGFLYERNLTDAKIDFLGYPFTFYDAFNAEARAMYWEQMRSQLFVRGIDAWWMDATEPEVVEGPYASPELQVETFQSYMHPTALGSGSRVLNAYSLFNSQAVYEGQRAAAPDQRVFILTRNGFAGQQRYAAATWSGDISSTWTALKKQIPAGQNFSLSGIPYWTVDSGGFAVPPRFATNPTPEAVTEWNELNTRWFQYATFLPLLRVHGQFPLREMWEFGGDDSPSFQAMLFFDRLRYRLQPYLYSLAGQATHEGGTLLRPLVMDYPNDVQARNVPDQFGLGPAFMVSPVTTYQERSRSVYLPGQGTWYDLWTGAATTGGQAITAAAPYESIPVHVPAGSLIPYGPEIQYTREKPADPIVLYVYAGADGAFTLYEDDGTTYAYERGELSRIPLAWNDATRTLSIGAREGSFPGMLEQRTFQVVLVTPTKPVALTFTPEPDAVVSYTGAAVSTLLE